ncbi:hypothetical protein D8O27_00775 [Burkholderia mallei]|uniref:Uncharacterized protein n=2 Tax=Burkholderia mallei TaxID=13373 RepID=A2S283_BURM9|nr:conserved hypothetical protein [Burkholderia mallei SAVP1]ABN01954.1 conserved hypothetical protein [Burkholderia mallei NCTC 10229]AIW49329.1 hypothetical protein DM57_14845 [Burkholderia mallei]EDK56639.1 conserved hypothetical protein [Burkholderia mallei FMH]EDK60810.1 conserved hypothetical protein [Burkholderia mallei JHU]EDP89288.1 conserved hypothetical protein [Burkholderia mallei ATCC 10399]EEP83717.1 conserved hypothetical protein [Burkholderia mallei GB8 horse 4]EES43195.1 con
MRPAHVLSTGNTCAAKSADRSLKPESAYARIKNVDKTHINL